MKSIKEEYTSYLLPPLSRSSVLKVISEMDGRMTEKYTIKSLREQYPNLPRLLPLEMLAKIGHHLLEGGRVSDFEQKPSAKIKEGKPPHPLGTCANAGWSIPEKIKEVVKIKAQAAGQSPSEFITELLGGILL